MKTLASFLAAAVSATFVFLLCAVRAEPPVPGYLPPSNQYGPPGQGRPQNQYVPPRQTAAILRPGVQYGAPSPNQQYGAPAPNQQYGAPGPSQQYGAPGGGQGYGRGGGYNDDQSEPANYNFQYDVQDSYYGVDFGHQESRQGDSAQGRYYVLLPDGRRQVVDYVADQDGYKPKISYEGTARSGGGYSEGGYPNAGGHSNGGGYSNDNQGGGGGNDGYRY